MTIMHLRETLSTRLGGKPESNWESILNKEKLLGLGWQAVPAKDGTNCYSWGETMEKVKQKCLGIHIMNGWCLDPVVIEHQKLFRMEPVFCEKIASMPAKLRFIMNVRKKFLVGDNHYRQIRCHYESFTNNSIAYSSSLDGLVEMQLPQCLTLTKLVGITSYGPWYTDGHIATGRDDSITYVPIRKKLMLIAKRGKPSRRLEALFTSAKSLIDCLSKPPSKLMRRIVMFCLIDATPLLIQPALWANTVIAFNKSPALGVGFEGKNSKDHERRQQVLSYYSSGVDQNKKKVWLDVASDKAVLKKVKSSTRRTTALQEHLEFLQYDRNPKKVRKFQNGVRVPKRLQKIMSIGWFRQKILRKIEQKAGNENVFFLFLLFSHYICPQVERLMQVESVFKARVAKWKLSFNDQVDKFQVIEVFCSTN